METKSSRVGSVLMGENHYICFHEDRLLAWAVFFYCLLVAVSHFVRLVANAPLSVVPGLSKHPIVLVFLLTVGIFLWRTRCTEERLLFSSVAIAYGFVIVFAAVPHLQVAVGIWGRVLMVILWGSATALSVRILAQKRVG